MENHHARTKPEDPHSRISSVYVHKDTIDVLLDNPGDIVMVRIPSEVCEFLRNNKQVLSNNGRGRWISLKALRSAVIAGKADDWHVVDFSDTGEPMMSCAYCAAGVEHSDESAPTIVAKTSGTLH
jgi:hypothetical protein